MNGFAAAVFLLFSADDGTIVTSKNTSLAARDLVLEEKGGKLAATFLDASGARRTVPADEIVEIVLGGNRLTVPQRFGAADVEITLTTGDVVMGQLGAKPADGVLLTSKVYGNPTFKFDQIRWIVFPANRAALPKKLPETKQTDLVLKKSQDRAKATVNAVSGAGVEYYSEVRGKDVVEPLSQIAAIVMVEFKAPPKEPSSLFSILLTSDGSSMRGAIRSFKEGILTFQDLFGTEHRVPANEVAGIYMKNGKVVYLSDIDPKDVQEDANFIRGPEKSPSDLEYPYQRDRSAKGTKLLIGGVEHRKGLGVRAHSSLTYPLDGAFKRFQATVGLDAVSMGLGAVTAEVWVDGKKLKDITLRGADPPQALDLDVSGANELKLVVTWAGNGQSDFTDWGSARLIR